VVHINSETAVQINSEMVVHINSETAVQINSEIPGTDPSRNEWLGIPEIGGQAIPKYSVSGLKFTRSTAE
jgi:hypothetical protein